MYACEGIQLQHSNQKLNVTIRRIAAYILTSLLFWTAHLEEMEERGVHAARKLPYLLDSKHPLFFFHARDAESEESAYIRKT